MTIHNTSNDASAANEVAYMLSNNNQTSYHYAVDDKEAVQAIPLNRNAWHAGDGGSGTGNRKSIGIEICYSKSGGSRFDKAEKNAAYL
ncbi:peptidoglycan recognition protein family protein, partial [Pseudomonas aeruginosa]|uniref:peptidoglycan recognition protein family protein n=1 Tax=Pseudomonas aeruginosa TaxID=287 RepID=UPI0035A04EB0